MSDVRVNLVVDQKGDAAARMQDLAKQTDMAARAARQLGVDQAKANMAARDAAMGGELFAQRKNGTVRPPLLPIPNAGQPDQQMVRPGSRQNDDSNLGALVTGGKIFAAFRAAEYGLQTLEKVTNALGDTSLTAAQRFNSLAVSIVPGLETFVKIRENILGVTDALRQNVETFAIQEAKRGAYAERNLARLGTDFERTQLRSNASASGQVMAEARGIRARGLPDDRSSVEAERRYQLEERSLGPTVQRLEAERDILSISQQQDFALQKRREVELQLGALIIGRERFQRQNNDLIAEENRLGGERMKGERDEVGRNIRQNETDIKTKAAELEKVISQQKTLQAQLGVADLARAAAQTGIARERLGILKEEEAALRGRLRSFGGLNRAEQAFAVQAARQLKAFGPESLAEGQKGILSRAGFGEQLGFEQQKAAERNPIFQEIQDLLAPGQNLKELQRQAAAIAIDVNIQPLLDFDKAANMLADKVTPLLQRQEQIFDVKVQAIVDKLKSEQLIGRNLRTP